MVSSKEDHVLPTFLVLSNIGQTGLIRAMVWTSIYLDFKKAFDSVDHVKLIEKLQNCNVESKLMKWIAAFLQNRKMKVKVKLQFSDWVYSCSEWSTSGLSPGASAVSDFCQRFAVMDPEQYDIAVC